MSYREREDSPAATGDPIPDTEEFPEEEEEEEVEVVREQKEPPPDMTEEELAGYEEYLMEKERREYIEEHPELEEQILKQHPELQQDITEPEPEPTPIQEPEVYEAEVYEIPPELREEMEGFEHEAYAVRGMLEYDIGLGGVAPTREPEVVWEGARREPYYEVSERMLPEELRWRRVEITGWGGVRYEREMTPAMYAKQWVAEQYPDLPYYEKEKLVTSVTAYYTALERSVYDMGGTFGSQTGRVLKYKWSRELTPKTHVIRGEQAQPFVRMEAFIREPPPSPETRVTITEESKAQLASQLAFGRLLGRYDFIKHVKVKTGEQAEFLRGWILYLEREKGIEMGTQERAASWYEVAERGMTKFGGVYEELYGLSLKPEARERALTQYEKGVEEAATKGYYEPGDTLATGWWRFVERATGGIPKWIGRAALGQKQFWKKTERQVQYPYYPISGYAARQLGPEKAMVKAKPEIARAFGFRELWLPMPPEHREALAEPGAPGVYIVESYREDPGKATAYTLGGIAGGIVSGYVHYGMLRLGAAGVKKGLEWLATREVAPSEQLFAINRNLQKSELLGRKSRVLEKGASIGGKIKRGIVGPESYPAKIVRLWKGAEARLTPPPKKVEKLVRIKELEARYITKEKTLMTSTVAKEVYLPKSPEELAAAKLLFKEGKFIGLTGREVQYLDPVTGKTVGTGVYVKATGALGKAQAEAFGTGMEAYGFEATYTDPLAGAMGRFTREGMAVFKPGVAEWVTPPQQVAPLDILYRTKDVKAVWEITPELAKRLPESFKQQRILGGIGLQTITHPELLEFVGPAAYGPIGITTVTVAQAPIQVPGIFAAGIPLVVETEPRVSERIEHDILAEVEVTTRPEERLVYPLQFDRVLKEPTKPYRIERPEIETRIETEQRSFLRPYFIPLFDQRQEMGVEVDQAQLQRVEIQQVPEILQVPQVPRFPEPTYDEVIEEEPWEEEPIWPWFPLLPGGGGVGADRFGRRSRRWISEWVDVERAIPKTIRESPLYRLAAGKETSRKRKKRKRRKKKR